MKALKEQQRLKVLFPQELYKKKGSEMDVEFKKNLKTQLLLFQESLDYFLTNNRSEINKNPSLRQEFYDLCREIGLDPLICTLYSASKGVCSGAPDNSQFYNDLAVQASTVCLALKTRTGGLMPVEECLKWVNKLRGPRHQVSLTDLCSALETLKVLGSGMSILEGESRVILTVPLELNLDQRELIEIARETGFVEYGMFRKWNRARFEAAVVGNT
jgi:ESCRT-II complex subunit VPS22